MHRIRQQGNDMDRGAENSKKRGLLLVLFVFAAVMLSTACSAFEGAKTVRPQGGVHYYQAGEDTQQSESKEETDAGEKLYVITSFHSTEETFTAYLFSNGLEYQFHYNMNTSFLDKYKNKASVAAFEPGKVVEVGHIGSDGIVEKVQISDQVWEYDNVTRFSVDMDQGMLKIADSKYHCDNTTYVFSGDQIITPSDITENDILTVIGQDKKILSILVTTGHGTLTLTNTSLFEGSYLQLDKKVFAQITPNLTMELSEGTYTLSVANNGWGGSQEITIERGKTTTVDLDAIKGEGPKYGKILFTVDVPDAVVCVDGNQIDYTNPVDIQYGKHTLTVDADGYEEWTRYLVVNSEEATIVINMITEEDAAKQKTEEASSGTGTDSSNTDNGSSGRTDTDSSSRTENKSSGTTNPGSGGSTDSTTEDTDYLKDYLSTLSQMLSSLTD